MKKIEKLQRKMSKFICFKASKWDLNYLNRLEFLQLSPLTVRRDIKVLKLINRIVLNDCIPQNWLNIFSFSKTKRLGNFIKISKSRINLCENNVFSYASKLYNSLPSYLRLSDNFTLNVKDVEKYLHKSYVENFTK